MTLTEQVAAIFRAKPNQWIDGHEFAKVGGYAGFTARIRDLRKAPYHWTIENEVTRHDFMGRRWTETKYRYVPKLDIDTAQRRDNVSLCHS